MSLKKLFLMGSSPISNNLDLVKPWVQQTDCWGINNVGMIWDAWKNGHSSPEYILIYFGCSDILGNTELSFSCRIGKSPGVQGCREDLRVAPNSLLIFHFNNRLQKLIFQQQTAAALLPCFVLILFCFVLRRNFRLSMSSWDLGVNYPGNISNRFCALDL